mmetsp:Transcript_7293/g.10866  ORF Transcript_7293/g.10866 Transcript_7293/m.10866 type:complete len:141 (+) Transcript_7293:74-496(+)
MATSDYYSESYNMGFFHQQNIVPRATSVWQESQQMYQHQPELFVPPKRPDYVSSNGTHHYNQNVSPSRALWQEKLITSRKYNDSSPGKSSVSSSKSSDEEWRGKEVVLEGGQRVYILRNVVNCDRHLNKLNGSPQISPKK